MYLGVWRNSQFRPLNSLGFFQTCAQIVSKSGQTWPVIEQEATDWQQLYVPYMVILAAIPAVAGFIGSDKLIRTG